MIDDQIKVPPLNGPLLIMLAAGNYSDLFLKKEDTAAATKFHFA